ncbi:alpha-D-ribose 1-methylphosphonate 5-triphosphate diphosphatase [Stappia sp.]|uniref:alpha-D-ribose 1-methylphosphonate 5-triphosphate diphosphatase n=1 Tax=Stappia sp. TaxID=1870903 RepID=UPI0032D935D7
MEKTLTNARIVLGDEVITGSVHVKDGAIVGLDTAPSSVTQAEDMEGDFLIPGLVELHTDHLENHYMPRPKVQWNPIAAVCAHDAQVSTSGITTVFDALRVGLDEDADVTGHDMRRLADAIEAGVARGRLRADHFIHLRCEVSAANCMEMFQLFDGDPRVRLASLMDHSPGQRQFASLDAYAVYYKGKMRMTDAEFTAFCEKRLKESATYSDKNRKAVAEVARERGIVLASHDDATRDHVEEAVDLGIRVAEFPTTVEAARASKEQGLAVLMGAPNVVRGGSHSGNVSARDLAERGLLDILSSDYIPFSMIQSAFFLGEVVEEVSLPQAVAMVTRNPAAAAGLDDRGEIALGKRADLVRVRVEEHIPIVRCVWREGRRVA